MLVGDLIIGCRERINDLPRTLSSPSSLLTAAVVAAVGSTLPVSNSYNIKATFVNQWGETLSTNEIIGLNVGVNQGIQITAPAIATVAGATAIRVYYGILTENQWVQSMVIPFTISAPGNPGVPPTRNSSFYPDIDGQRVNAYSLYRWLNQALDIATNIADGIPDMTALATVNTQTMYQVIGQWAKFDHGWWDGYQIQLGGRDILFYRNVVPGVVATGILQQISDRVIIELQPQPNRSGGVTTSPGAINIADTTLTLTDVSGFKLSFGMAIIGVPPDPSLCEVVSFSTISGANLTGVIRGMGGTVQRAWPAGVAVAEGNLRLSGRRSFVAPNYLPGDSLRTLSVPSGWPDPLMDYMVSRFREAEGNVNEANRLMTAFTKRIKDELMGNALVAGPRQVGLPGSGGLDTVPSRGLGGNIILPMYII